MDIGIYTVEGGGQPPTKFKPGDAGYDLYCNEEVYVHPESTVNIHTGVSVALPRTTWAQIMPRSSTMQRHRLHVLSAVIDNGYRGELFIQVYNPTHTVVRVEKGWRLAQLIPHALIEVDWIEGRLSTSEREDAGFGSTGV